MAWMLGSDKKSAGDNNKQDQSESEEAIKISEGGNAIFVICAYVQQFVIIVLGFLALLQIWYHVWLFHKPELAGSGIDIRLDPFSKLHEFGLEGWNQAINSIYWWLALALMVPIASRMSQPAGAELDIGQAMLNWLVPLLFLSPMLFTVATRQKKMGGVWARVRDEEEPSRIDLYHRQLLWPLDRNWASKLGIVLAFVMLSYLVGDAMANLKHIVL
jgi:hypothetical protein